MINSYNCFDKNFNSTFEKVTLSGQMSDKCICLKPNLIKPVCYRGLCVTESV